MIIADADSKGISVFLNFNKKNKVNKPNTKNIDFNAIMQNLGSEEFDYGTFKAAYDTDPRVKTMTNNFNKDGIEPKTAKTIDSKTNDVDQGKDDVEQMAKNATDLGDKL